MYYLLALLLAASGLAAAKVCPSLLELNKDSFFYGREYFILRSGRAQMLLQADRAALGPAFTWMLFDAQDAKQSARKDRAFNFVPNEGFGASALEVVLGGFPFTALGHRTDTRWVVAEGIPAVEAVWWAGGGRVTERISTLEAEGVFRRQVRLEGAHLAGEEAVSLRLRLPPSGPRCIRAARPFRRICATGRAGSDWKSTARRSSRARMAFCACQQTLPGAQW